MFSALTIGDPGCYAACFSEPGFASDGSCDKFCNGYCCRSDGFDSACKNEIMSPLDFPTSYKHYCLKRVASASPDV